MKKEEFVTLRSGEKASLYTLMNKDMTVTVTDLGATVIDIICPDKDGVRKNVNLGYGKSEDYLLNSCSFGAFVGRCANRIGNAAFSIDGKDYSIEKNDGENNLHSGKNRWYQRLWKATELSENSVSFSLESPDMDQGFPGKLTATITVTLSDDNTLIFDYSAVSDQKTIFSPTFHGYFNLSGEGNGDILSHELQIFADELTFAPKGSIPNGEIRNVHGTPMDFTALKTIGKDIEEDYDLLKFAGGYDHNYIMRKSPEERETSLDANGLSIFKNAVLYDPSSGRRMEVFSDMPGLQAYSGNFINDAFGRNGEPYHPHSGIALETQFYPNAINIPSFPQPLIAKDEKVFHRTAYRFSV